jgi:hypothetical protein
VVDPWFDYPNNIGEQQILLSSSLYQFLHLSFIFVWPNILLVLRRQ